MVLLGVGLLALGLFVPFINALMGATGIVVDLFVSVVVLIWSRMPVSACAYGPAWPDQPPDTQSSPPSSEFPPGNPSSWGPKWDPICPFSPCPPTRLRRMFSAMPDAVTCRATPEEPNPP